MFGDRLGAGGRFRSGYNSVMTDNRIREIRIDRGLSQQALADAVGTSKTQISKLEKSQRRLTDEWMRRLARALECHPAELMMDCTTSSLSSREEELLVLFRGLSEPQQEAFVKAVDALARPARKSGDKPED